MTADEIKALAGILHEDAHWVGQQFNSRIGDRIEKAADALETLSDQLLAKSELANLYAASLRQSEKEVEGLKADAARLASIRSAIADYHYALDTRRHGGLAQDCAFNLIERTLDMDWRQGEEKKRREAIDAARSRSDKEKP